MNRPIEDIATEVRLLESVFEQALDAKIVVDSKYNLIKANHTAQELLTIKQSDHHKLFTYFPRAISTQLRFLLKNIHENQRIRTELPIRLNGQERHLDISIISIMESSFIVLIFRDITPVVIARRSSDMFLAVAGHEIKTPLAIIQSYADLLHRKLKLDETNKQYIDKIYQNVEILSNYVNSIVDEIKIGTGKFEYNDTKEDFDQLITDIIAELKAVHKNRDIVLHGTTNCTLNIDRQRLKQVISNLVNNAFKYSSPESKVIIKVRSAKDTVTVAVKDNGYGISKKDQKKIFEAFYRTRKQYSRKSGLGLGLYIANQIVTNYKGTLSVHSKYRKGSTFQFTLPKNVS